MIVRQAIPLSLDRLWRETLKPADRSLRLPADLTGATVQIVLRQARHRAAPSDWWYGQPGATLGTDTGEIVNAGNALTVTARIIPGEYDVSGEYTKSGVTAPFIVGTLWITDYMSQLTLMPLGDI